MKQHLGFIWTCNLRAFKSLGLPDIQDGCRYNQVSISGSRRFIHRPQMRPVREGANAPQCESSLVRPMNTDMVLLEICGRFGKGVGAFWSKLRTMSPPHELETNRMCSTDVWSSVTVLLARRACSSVTRRTSSPRSMCRLSLTTMR